MRLMSRVPRNTPPHAGARPTLRVAARALVLLSCAAVFAVEAGAQPGPVTRPLENDAAPPPMKFIPGELRSRLSTEKDIKGRTKLSILLAAERLASAETHTQAENYEAAGIDLGIYQALISDAVQFIRQTNRKDNKARDNFKRIDLALREHTPRIEKIRRMTPAQSAVHVKAALDFVRQSRTEALESFYGDTVLREPPPQEPQPSDDQRAKSNPNEPQSKP